MPTYHPPLKAPATLVRETLRAGEIVYRVHAAGRAGDSFYAAQSDKIGEGGRFDSVDRSYSHSYVAQSVEAAIAETLFRELGFSLLGLRFAHRAALKHRMLSKLRVARDLEILSLIGAGSSRIGQDEWVTTCAPEAFLATREWAVALRAWAPRAQGLVWISRPSGHARSYVIFGDRAPGSLTVAGRSLRLEGGAWPETSSILASHNIGVTP